MYGVVSISLLVVFAISFFSTVSFNIRRRKSFLNKLSNIYSLVILIVAPFFILCILKAQVIVLPGINVQELNELSNPLASFYTMEINFTIFRLFSVITLLITSLIMFWKNRKHNRITYSK